MFIVHFDNCRPVCHSEKKKWIEEFDKHIYLKENQCICVKK